MDIQTAIIAVVNTLDDIEVKGADNMRSMINCIDTLKACVDAINNAKEVNDGGADTENG